MTALAAADRKYPDGNIPMKTTTVEVDTRLEVDVYADFARAIRARKPAFVRPEEPLALMRLIERCRKASGRILRTSAWTAGKKRA